MPKSKTDYALPLTIAQILYSNTDEKNWLTIPSIKKILSAEFGYASKQYPEQKTETCKKPLPSDELVKKILVSLRDFFDNEQLKSSDSISPQIVLMDEPNKTLKAYLTKRCFDNEELDCLIQAFENAPFSNASKSNDVFIMKLNDLKSPAGKKDKDLLNTTPLRETLLDSSRKPSSTEVVRNYRILRRAIAAKKTVSFSYCRYGAKKDAINGGQLAVTRVPVKEVKGINPYLVRYIDNHYFLLAGGKRKNTLGVFRVDLLDNLIINDEAIYRKRSEDELDGYFAGSINGYSGKEEVIVLKCNNKAIHYVIEHFSEFEDFTMNEIEDEPGIVKVSFKGYPRGVALWCQKFIDSIEFSEPKNERDALIERIGNNRYGFRILKETTCPEKNTPLQSLINRRDAIKESSSNIGLPVDTDLER